ncbi:hypothetical protein P389DRAFT_36425 [Cystobasidium minutum MCA 4210]|uniref:uncharacterized protein n=1 Tax=Cystobasidium minutum MCA 4210 TaxID=1397322 RepID=UPI0034CE4FA2|eukprot:jgi/Rhomi1/36425/CE36424_49
MLTNLLPPRVPWQRARLFSSTSSMKGRPTGAVKLDDFRERTKRFFRAEVESNGARWALMSYCFMSGCRCRCCPFCGPKNLAEVYIWSMTVLACVSFSACSIWCVTI